MTRELSFGVEVQLDDGPHILAERGYGLLKFRSVISGEYVVIPETELPRRLVDLPERPAGHHPGVLTELPETDVEAARFWEGHLREVIDGTSLHPEEAPRPEYDPTSTSMTQRVQRKVHELKVANAATVSERTLWRMVKEYKASGLLSLIKRDGRKDRDELPLDRADRRYVEVLREVVASQTNASTVPKKRLYHQVKTNLLARYPGEVIEVPALSTFYRHFAYVAAGTYVSGKATLRRTAANTPKHAFRTERKLRPGEEVQVDSTTLDVLVLDDDGVSFRPTLTFLIDVATRSIIASTIRRDAKGFDHAMLLARCVVPRRLRPGRDEAWERVVSQLPWAELLTPEQRADIDASRPYILPDRIMMDNGRDFRSEVFEAAAKYYGIILTWSAPGTPTDKPYIERGNRSVKDMFAAYLPAFTGGSVDNRGLNIEKQPMLTIDVLNEIFDEWVARVWQRRPHGGLRHPDFPGKLMSPNEAYAAAFELTGTVLIPFTADDFIELLPAHKAVIHPFGIKHANRKYDSPELVPFRGRPSPDDRSTRQWTFKFNPYDARAVWVRDPEDGHWIECVARDWDFNRSAFAHEVTMRYGQHIASRPQGMSADLERDFDSMIARATATARKADVRSAIANRLLEAEQLLADHQPAPEPDFYDDEPDDEDVDLFVEMPSFNPYNEELEN